MECICGQCGRHFRVRPVTVKIGKGKFCSAACYQQFRRASLQWRGCLQCGKSFTIRSSQVKKGRGKFCSKACYDVAQRCSICRNCEWCGTQFVAFPSTIREGKGRFCSYVCGRLAMRTRLWQTCAYCGVAFEAIPARNQRFCSPPCFAESRRRADDTTGYTWCEAPDGRWRGKHRIIAEQVLGRVLRPGEVVHHVNRARADNRPENLRVFVSKGEHTRWHRQQERLCYVLENIKRSLMLEA